MSGTHRGGAGSMAFAAALVAAVAAGGCARRAAAPPAPPTPAASAYMASSAPAFHYPTGVLTAAAVQASRTGALCGSLLQACPAGEMGKAAAQEPKAGTVGGFTEVDLNHFFDSAAGAEGAVPAGGPPPRYAASGWGAPGINGTPYPEQFFPSTGNFTVAIHGLPVTFLIPAEGVGIRSTFDLANPVDVPVPPGAYRAAWILGQGIGGGAGEVAVRAVYDRGATGDAGFDLTGWCHPAALAPGEFPAVIAPNLLSNSGGTMKPAFTGCGGLYAVAVPLDSSRTLSSLDILGATASLLGGTPGGASHDFIVALSLQR